MGSVTAWFLGSARRGFSRAGWGIETVSELLSRGRSLQAEADAGVPIQQMGASESAQGLRGPAEMGRTTLPGRF